MLYEGNNLNELIDLLTNINKNLDILLKDNNYNNNNASQVKENINNIKNTLINNSNIDLETIKKTSGQIYELNANNDFSDLTDSISNDYYSFNFILEEYLKKEKK